MTRLTRRITNRVYAIIVERILCNSDTEMIKEFYEAIEKRAEQIEQIKRYHQMTLLDKWWMDEEIRDTWLVAKWVEKKIAELEVKIDPEEMELGVKLLGHAAITGGCIVELIKKGKPGCGAALVRPLNEAIENAGIILWCMAREDKLLEKWRQDRFNFVTFDPTQKINAKDYIKKMGENEDLRIWHERKAEWKGQLDNWTHSGVAQAYRLKNKGGKWAHTFSPPLIVEILQWVRTAVVFAMSLHPVICLGKNVTGKHPLEEMFETIGKRVTTWKDYQTRLHQVSLKSGIVIKEQYPKIDLSTEGINVAKRRLKTLGRTKLPNITVAPGEVLRIERL